MIAALSSLPLLILVDYFSLALAYPVLGIFKTSDHTGSNGVLLLADYGTPIPNPIRHQHVNVPAYSILSVANDNERSGISASGYAGLLPGMGNEPVRLGATSCSRRTTLQSLRVLVLLSWTCFDIAFACRLLCASFWHPVPRL